MGLLLDLLCNSIQRGLQLYLLEMDVYFKSLLHKM